MDVVHHWNPGETLVIRGTWERRLIYGCPVYCVRDTPELIALYLPAGTVGWQLPGRPTAQDMRHLEEIGLIEHTWVETDVLLLTIPGEGSSVWLMWETGTSTLRCWYINLEEPWRRTPLGFDSMDWQLDIVVRPDRQGWHWKDEAEFAAWVETGLISPADARAIRASGKATLRRLLANEPPYCEGWEKWQPPAGWGIPVLPEGWDRL